MTRRRTLKLDSFAPYRLSIASNTVSDVIASAYRALFGLTIPEWRLVAILAEHDRFTQQDLGVATRMDKVTVSRAATALFERALVTRAPNLEDKRSHLLSLSPAGLDLYSQVAPKALELENLVLASFTSAEISQLMSMLERMEAAALELASRAQTPETGAT
jgi:DNA-binding MarR family transcriptional regulator